MIKSIRWTSIALLWALLLATGCADSEPPGTDNDINDGYDVGNDISDGDTSTDGDTDDDADVDPCPVCCPEETRCSTDGQAVEICTADGQGFEILETCGDGQLCEEAECVDEPVCEPGDQICDGSEAILTCRATGTGYTSSSCPEGQSCYDDECVDGASTGHLCGEEADCAGGKCRCGAEESCVVDHPAYCTSECTPGSCPGDEICWHADGAEAAGYDHCIPPCGAGACNLSECADVLTEIDGDWTWRSACIPEALIAIGESCESDSHCVSGTCDDDSYDFNFCTRRCEEGGCPDGTACTDPQGSGQYWCYPECEGATCGDFSTNCSPHTIYGSDQLVYVCQPDG